MKFSAATKPIVTTTTTTTTTTTALIFCSPPPSTPFGSLKKFLNQTDQRYDNVEGTIIEYKCQNVGFAFNYSVDPNAISFAETKNIEELDITCNDAGYVTYNFDKIGWL